MESLASVPFVRLRRKQDSRSAVNALDFLYRRVPRRSRRYKRGGSSTPRPLFLPELLFPGTQSAVLPRVSSNLN